MFDANDGADFWAEPIFLTGDYPQSMREYFGDRLPKLSKEQQKLLKGSGDFCESRERGQGIRGGTLTQQSLSIAITSTRSKREATTS